MSLSQYRPDEQECPILLLEGQYQAEFSSNQLQKTCLEDSSESEDQKINMLNISDQKSWWVGGTPRTPHTIGAKWLNLGFFVLMFVVSHILKILYDFNIIVNPALAYSDV